MQMSRSPFMAVDTAFETKAMKLLEIGGLNEELLFNQFSSFRWTLVGRP